MNTENPESALSNAEKKCDVARESYRTACGELKEAQEAVIAERYGVRREGIVRRTRDGKEFKVASMTYAKHSAPLLSGWLRKKNGTFAAKVQFIGMGWEVVK